jgi:hypothetical protein
MESLMRAAGWAAAEIAEVLDESRMIRMDDRDLFHVPLTNRMAPRVRVDGGYNFLGYHATTVHGCRGILHDRRVRRIGWDDNGVGLVLCKATMYGNKIWEKKRCLGLCLNSGLAAQGIVVELHHSSRMMYKTLHYGGHEAEIEASNAGFVTNYAGRGRWTLPETNTEVTAIYIDPVKLGAVDVEQELADLETFAPQ